MYSTYVQLFEKRSGGLELASTSSAVSDGEEEDPTALTPCPIGGGEEGVWPRGEEEGIIVP